MKPWQNDGDTHHHFHEAEGTEAAKRTTTTYKGPGQNDDKTHHHLHEGAGGRRAIRRTIMKPGAEGQ